MKVGLVIEHFDPRRGGVEQWTAQFAAALAARGHEVHVVAASFARQTDAMPIVAHRLDEVRCRIGFAKAAEETLRALDLDIIHDTGCGWHCHVFQPHGGSRRVAAERNILLAPRWLRPIKRAVNGLSPRYRQFNALLKKQYADDGRIVVALSRRVAADLNEIHGVPPDRIRLVYNGVDTERFSPRHRAALRDPLRSRLSIAPHTLMLLIVAHNFRLKGVPMLLEAMAARRQPRPLHLVVAGGKRLRRYRRMANRLGIGAAVTFVGSVDDTVPFYAAADVYVHPTYYDPCSLVALEALASGLPVITSRQNGVAELIEDGRQGFLLDGPVSRDGPGSRDEFLDRLERLLDDRRREEMGRHARQLALRHSFDANVDALAAVYEEVLQERRAAGDDMFGKTTKPFVYLRTGEQTPAAADNPTPPSVSGAIR